MSPRLYAIRNWKIQRCAGCLRFIPKKVVALFTQTDVFCNRECAALHTLNHTPTPQLTEVC